VIEEEKKEEKNEEKEKNKEDNNSQNNIISLFEDLNNHEDNDLSEELTTLSLYQQKKKIKTISDYSYESKVDSIPINLKSASSIYLFKDGFQFEEKE